MQYNPQTSKFRIRLLEQFVQAKLNSITKEKNITIKDLEEKADRKYGQLRNMAKTIVIDNVTFNQKHLLKLSFALNNNLPIAIQLVKKLSPQKDIGYYLQMIFEEETIPTVKLSGYSKTMGIDLNQKGIGYCIVKNDGNKLRNGYGFIKWDLEDNSVDKKNHIISNKLSKLLDIAQKYSVYSISIENLDFSKTINKINSGYKTNPKYNKIITQFSSNRFKELLIRKAKRLGITVKLVNPTYSSIGGYSKYGLINKLPVDISAALWLARQAIFGEEYKKEENIIYIKKFEESVSLPYINQSKQSKRLINIEPQWKDIGLELGKDRKLWYKHTMVFINKISNSGISLLQQDFNPFEDPLETYLKGGVDVQVQEYKELERPIKLAST